MKLSFLGSTSQEGQCPTLYATDRETDPEALGDLRDVLPGETFVEVPKALLRFAEGDR